VLTAVVIFKLLCSSSLSSPCGAAPVLFKDGKKLWKRFDAAMREMKRDYNPIWDE